MSLIRLPGTRAHPRGPSGPGGPTRPGGPGVVSGGETYGDAPLPIPVVLSIGVSSLTPTSVTLVGSVSTIGLPGTWWFQWGFTPQMTSQSSASTITSSVPVTQQLSLTGLIPSKEYWFSIVARTAGGTVVSIPLTFLTENLVGRVNFQSTSVEVPLPHFSWPFTVSNNGVDVVHQNDDACINTCVSVIVNCTTGEFPEIPGFGIPDHVFSQIPLDTDGLAATIIHWEPRATEEIISVMQRDGSTGSWTVGITTEA